MSGLHLHHSARSSDDERRRYGGRTCKNARERASLVIILGVKQVTRATSSPRDPIQTLIWALINAGITLASQKHAGTPGREGRKTGPIKTETILIRGLRGRNCITLLCSRQFCDAPSTRRKEKTDVKLFVKFALFLRIELYVGLRNR